MSRTIVQNAVCTRTGTTKLAVPPPVTVTVIALDAICRSFATAGGQTVTPEIVT